MKTLVPAFLCLLTIIFSHPHNVVAGNPGNKNLKLEKPYNIHQFLKATLYTSTGMIADGNTVAFDDTFNNDIDGNDAHKVMNFGENFGIMRDDQLLAIEARSPLQLGDTIFYNLQNLRQQDYQLRFVPIDLQSSGLTAYLYDKYLNTNTLLSLADSNFINISITAEPGSSAAGRFMVVFTKSRITELNFINLTASWNSDKTVALKWNVENERDVDHYTIERSNTGQDFTGFGLKTPTGNNGGSVEYIFQDINANMNGNYYRISANDHYGQFRYSAIVKIGMNEGYSISIFPNPVKDKVMNIHFKNQQPAGIYKVQLTNKMGQVVYTTDIDITGTADQIKTVRLDNKMITTGTYQVSIIPASGKKITQQVMIR